MISRRKTQWQELSTKTEITCFVKMLQHQKDWYNTAVNSEKSSRASDAKKIASHPALFFKDRDADDMSGVLKIEFFFSKVLG